MFRVLARLHMATASSALGWFSLAWMMAYALHFIDLGPRHLHLVVLGLLAVPSLLMPGSVPAFAAFLVGSTGVSLVAMPAAANHLVLAMLVDVALLAAGIGILVQRPTARIVDPQASASAHWLHAARVPAALTLLVVYAWACLHKLNASFFDPRVSCAGDITTRVTSLFGISTPPPDSVILVLAVATIAIEAAIPMLLAVRGWRPYGLAAGVGFHVILGAGGFEDFATFAFAVYILMMADVVPHVPNRERWAARALAAWGAHMILAEIDALLMPTIGGHLPGYDQLRVFTWVAGALALMGPLVATSLAQPERDALRLWPVRSAWVLVLPLVAVLNGMAPYLGLKTVATFSMFSNLRTEDGRSNSLLTPGASFEVTPWLRDTVDVLAFDMTGPPSLNIRGRLTGGVAGLSENSRWVMPGASVPIRVPWLELRRTIVRWKQAGATGVSVRYARGGIETHAADAVNDPVLAAPLPWWARWLVAFHDIEITDAVACRW